MKSKLLNNNKSIKNTEKKFVRKYYNFYNIDQHELYLFYIIIIIL